MNSFDIFLDFIINILLKKGWLFFTSLFFSWTSVLLTTIFLIIIFFKGQIREVIIRTNANQINNNVHIKSNSDTQKNETAKQTKQKNWKAKIALGISFIALIWSIVWGIYLDKKYMPLQRSDIIIIEPMVIPKENQDELNQIFKNVGKVTANNIKFRIYSIVIDKEILNKYKENKLKSLSKLFDSKIIHRLPPGTEAPVGKIIQSHIDVINGQLINTETQKIITEKKIELNFVGKQMALIYDLEYSDDLDQKIQNKFFFFQYQIGGSNQLPIKILTLIDEDYEIIYCELKDELTKLKVDALNNEKKKFIPLLNFINENPPIGWSGCG